MLQYKRHCIAYIDCKESQKYFVAKLQTSTSDKLGWTHSLIAHTEKHVRTFFSGGERLDIALRKSAARLKVSILLGYSANITVIIILE